MKNFKNLKKNVRTLLEACIIVLFIEPSIAQFHSLHIFSSTEY